MSISGQMREAWSILGEWWLPENEDYRCFGRLSWSVESGGELEVYSELIPDSDRSDQPTARIPRIDGKSIDGELLSLWSCHNLGNSRTGLVCTRQTFSSNRILVGFHGDEDDLSCSRVSLEYDNLGSWLRCYTSMQLAMQDGIGCSGGYLPELVLGHLGDVLVTLFIQASLEGSPVAHQVMLSEKHIIILRSYDIITLKDALELEHNLRNLFAFATGAPVTCTRCLLKTKNIRDGRKIYFLWNQTGQNVPRIESNLIVYNAIIHPGDPSQFSNLVQSWLDLSPQMRLLLMRRTALSYLPWVYIELEFLTLVFCLEEFHSMIFDGSELPEDEHLARVAAVLEATPSKLKSWAEEQLKYSNSLSFRRKLTNLLSTIPKNSIALDVIGSKSRFKNDVLNTRNYHVHHDPRLANKALSGEALFRLSEKLAMILELLALMQLNSSIPILDDLVRRRWRHLVP